MYVYLSKVSWQSVFKNVLRIGYNYFFREIIPIFQCPREKWKLKNIFCRFWNVILKVMATTGSGLFTEDQVLLQVDVQ